MPRVFGKSVTVSDSILDGVPQGRVHTILFDDDEAIPLTADEVEEFLTVQADTTPAILDASLEAAMLEAPIAKGASETAETIEDKVQTVLGVLDALKASADPEAVDWTNRRLKPE